MFQSLHTLEDIPRALVLHAMPDGELRSAELALLRADGTLEGVASFGADSPLLPPTESVWSSGPRSRAARTGAPVVMEWGDGTPGAYVAVPVTCGTTTYGVISCWVNSAEEELVKDAGAALTFVARLLSTAMALAPELNQLQTDGRAQRQQPTLRAIPDLTPRQLDVLALMSERLTNAQVARRLKFSESTVRMETIAIYRALGVHARSDAVRLARELGLVPDEQAETVEVPRAHSDLGRAEAREAGTREDGGASAEGATNISQIARPPALP